jgi:hypothetical protein
VLTTLRVEPLGHFERLVPPLPGLLVGAGAVFAATGLLELSRSLAETFRGRWFAGNGRDLFHGLAAFVAAAAFFVNGLPAALACLYAASSLLVPLLLLDGLPARRSARTGLLFALIACAALPALLKPESIVSTANTLTRTLF